MNRWLILCGGWLLLTTLLMVVGAASAMAGYDELAAALGVMFVTLYGGAIVGAMAALSVALIWAGFSKGEG